MPAWHVLADAEGAGADGAVLGGGDGGVGQVQASLLLDRCGVLLGRLGFGLGRLQHGDLLSGVGQRRLGALQVGRALQQQRLALLRLLDAAGAGVGEFAVALLILGGEGGGGLGGLKLG